MYNTNKTTNQAPRGNAQTPPNQRVHGLSLTIKILLYLSLSWYSNSPNGGKPVAT